MGMIWSRSNVKPPRAVHKSVRYDDYVKQMPNLVGKVVLVTGANEGLGLEVAKACARKGATVILGCRSHEKAKMTAEKIGKPVVVPEAGLELGTFGAVKKFAAEMGTRKIDVLINNAAIMAIPETISEDGYNLQMQVNMLSHFMLTALLKENLKGGRVVWLATGPMLNKNQHHWIPSAILDGTFNEAESITGGDKSKEWATYACTKLAGLRFAAEFKRRGLDIESTAVNPGFCTTDLQPRAVEAGGSYFFLMTLVQHLFGQSAEDGCLMELEAAFKAPNGSFVEPEGYTRGAPRVAGDCAEILISGQGKAKEDEQPSRILWEACEKVVGLKLD